MNNKVGIFFVLILGLISCGKDKFQVIPVVVVYSNYSALDTNNFWVYEHFSLDTNGALLSLNQFDSVYVEKDTTWNDKRYFKVIQKDYDNGGVMTAKYMRDSSGYTVDSAGAIILATVNLGTTFKQYVQYGANVSDTFALVSAQVIAETVMDSTPVGKFQTINYKTTYVMGANYQQGGKVRYVSSKYAEKVGLVYKTLPFNAASSNYEVLLLSKYGKTK